MVVLLCYRERGKLEFSICCAFELHCQLGKMVGAMCSVDDHAIVSDEVPPYNGPCESLHYDQLFCKGMVDNYIKKNLAPFRLIILSDDLLVP